MAVDYAAWLSNADNDANRTLLVDVNVYNGGSEITRKLSTRPAEPAGAYNPVVTEIPIFEQRIREAWGGRTFNSVGHLDIDNAEGDYDDWLNDGWGGREIKLYFGDADWIKNDYGLIRTGVVDQLQVVNDQILRIVFRDRQGELDKLIQLNTVDDGENGEVEIPLGFGKIYRATPVLVDTTTHKYQVHDGTINAINTVYEDDVATGLTVMPSLSTGTFTLSGKPAGRLTVDFEGAKPSAWLEKPGEIVREIVTTYGGLADPGDIDTTAFTSFDTSAPQIGLYITRPTNILRVLDDICASVMGWYGINRDGKFTVGKITSPTAGTSILTVREELQETNGDLVTFPQDTPRHTTRIGYQRAWSKSNNPASTISEKNREWLRRGYRVAEYVDANKTTIETEHLDTDVSDIEDTLISNGTDANAEAQSRQGLLNQARFVCSVGVYATPFNIDIGSVITIHDDRFGFDVGRPVLVIGFEERLAEGLILIEGWY
jgi:hypothetical protein